MSQKHVDRLQRCVFVVRNCELVKTRHTLKSEQLRQGKNSCDVLFGRRYSRYINGENRLKSSCAGLSGLKVINTYLPNKRGFFTQASRWEV